jgi:hypothetical protein
MVRKILSGSSPNNKHSMTMFWASFSLITATPWPIIVRHYQMLSVSTLLTTKKYTPFLKLVGSGDITFLGMRQSSTLIISHYISCRHKENYRMTNIKSGPHTYNNSTSTSSIKHESKTTLLIALVYLQSQDSPQCSNLAAMRLLDGANSMRQTQTSPPPTKCWVKMQLSIISIFRMGCCVI